MSYNYKELIFWFYGRVLGWASCVMGELWISNFMGELWVFGSMGELWVFGSMGES